MRRREERWFDEAAGPLVRPYAVTRGRTRSDVYGLDLLTLVVAVPSGNGNAHLQPEHAQIVRLCQYPLSVAEVSARVDLPLAVVKVLLGDLIEQRQLIFRSAAPSSEVPEKHVLQAVLDGIRKL
ncbi:hypothetical protein CFN78_09910 [Amycolatopsis antarctica]|uniref:DUF742 domain-containing protein n=1 Tax=Amycolatopsis antarctica TaxID=1854586 RepID=A0A263D3X4_9PSEU|nr:DUF742 domain-containing protein [Amycolatopsis antarctica]OZM73182.1 hypothetical protein CFN78_09910 [Amycolatopsis antarctica]